MFAPLIDIISVDLLNYFVNNKKDRNEPVLVFIYYCFLDEESLSLCYIRIMIYGNRY